VISFSPLVCQPRTFNIINTMLRSPQSSIHFRTTKTSRLGLALAFSFSVFGFGASAGAAPEYDVKRVNG
jgi:hypothetical protein